MQVVALEPGFYAGARRRRGDIFEMSIDDPKKLPKWVKAAPNAGEARREAAAVKKAAEEKQRAGVVAASGGKAAKDKAEALTDLAG